MPQCSATYRRPEMSYLRLQSESGWHCILEVRGLDATWRHQPALKEHLTGILSSTILCPSLIYPRCGKQEQRSAEPVARRTTTATATSGRSTAAATTSGIDRQHSRVAGQAGCHVTTRVGDDDGVIPRIARLSI